MFKKYKIEYLRYLAVFLLGMTTLANVYGEDAQVIDNNANSSVADILPKVKNVNKEPVNVTPLTLPPAKTVPATPLLQKNNQMALPPGGLPNGMTKQGLMKMMQQQMGGNGGSPQKSLMEQLGNEVIDDVYQPVDIVSTKQIIIYVVAAIIALVVLWLIIKWIRKPKPVIIRKPYEIAFDELERIKALMDNETSKAFSILVSNALRQYIEERFKVTSTCATTDEFMSHVKKDKIGALKDHMELLHDFLEFCDLAKFAGCEFSKEKMKGMMNSAWTFVDETKEEEVLDNTTESENKDDSTVVEADVISKGGVA